MASMEEVVFLIGFLVFVGLWFFKLYNVVTGFDKFSTGVVWMATIGCFLSYGVTLVSFLSGTYQNIYASLFTLQTWLFYLVWLFLFIELFIYIGRSGTGQRKAYKSLGDK